MKTLGNLRHWGRYESKLGNTLIMLEADWVGLESSPVWKAKENESKSRPKKTVPVIRDSEESLFWVVFCIRKTTGHGGGKQTVPEEWVPCELASMLVKKYTHTHKTKILIRLYLRHIVEWSGLAFHLSYVYTLWTLSPNSSSCVFLTLTDTCPPSLQPHQHTHRQTHRQHSLRASRSP